MSIQTALGHRRERAGLIGDESALFLVKSSPTLTASLYRSDETIVVTCCNIWLLYEG
jgi:hypothetical protein